MNSLAILLLPNPPNLQSKPTQTSSLYAAYTPIQVPNLQIHSMVLECFENLYIIETHEEKERADPDLFTASSLRPCSSSCSRSNLAMSTRHSLQPNPTPTPRSRSLPSTSGPLFSTSSPTSSPAPSLCPSGTSAIASPRFKRSRTTWAALSYANNINKFCTRRIQLTTMPHCPTYYLCYMLLVRLNQFQAVCKSLQSISTPLSHLFNIGVHCWNLRLCWSARQAQANAWSTAIKSPILTQPTCTDAKQANPCDPQCYANCTADTATTRHSATHSSGSLVEYCSCGACCCARIKA